MVACSSARYWGLEIGRQGHEIRLIPPAYVKPFVNRQKNDTSDAEAICEAANRPTMRFGPFESEETQRAAMVFQARDLLVRQRMQLINALRGHLGEQCQVAPQGPRNTRKPVETVEDRETVTPEAAQSCLYRMIGMLIRLNNQIREPDAEIAASPRAMDPVFVGFHDLAFFVRCYNGMSTARGNWGLAFASVMGTIGSD